MLNTVKLLGYYGGDETHCLSAWQSTSIELENLSSSHEIFEQTKTLKKKSPLSLLTFLAEHQHHTPFEKSCLHFQIRADIATHIHFLKHRIGVSINTESARYKELEDKWYIPDDWVTTPVIKNELINLFGNCKNWGEVLEEYTYLGLLLYHQACDELTPVLGRSRAKESSRYFLNYNKQLDFDAMFNFRSFIHFLNLRNSEHAQKEIKSLAEQMLSLVQTIPENPFKLSLQAFNYDYKNL